MAVFHGSCFGDSITLAKGMEFSLLERSPWLDERSLDSSPSIKVTFPDGYIDRLVYGKIISTMVTKWRLMTDATTLGT